MPKPSVTSFTPGLHGCLRRKERKIDREGEREREKEQRVRDEKNRAESKREIQREKEREKRKKERKERKREKEKENEKETASERKTERERKRTLFRHGRASRRRHGVCGPGTPVVSYQVRRPGGAEGATPPARAAPKMPYTRLNN